MKVGDKVTWSSQAGSYTTTKSGVIVAIVPPGVKPPTKHRLAEWVQWGLGSYQCVYDGFGRKHESYLVAVPNKSGKGWGKVYWPRVSALKLVEGKS